MRRHHFLFFILTCLLSTGLRAEQINIAVASNFALPMKKLSKDFEATTSYQLRVSYGSSGKLFAQIKHGAPYALFLSADQEKPRLIESQQIGVAGTRFTYAIGRLALWSSQSKLPNERLLQGNYQRLAIANPKLAPYGIAANETLEQLALKHDFSPRLVFGENISQTYQFTRSGNTDMGFVALSQIINDKHSSTTPTNYWLVPTHLHSPIKQDVILLKSAASNQTARTFLNYLRSTKARKIIQAYGYDLPPLQAN